MNGPAFERELKRDLESLGYSVVRGAASKGEFLNQKVDLVASKQNHKSKRLVFLTVVGIQCKVSGRGR